METASDEKDIAKKTSDEKIAFKIPSLSKVSAGAEKKKNPVSVIQDAGADAADAAVTSTEGKEEQAQSEKTEQSDRARKDSEIDKSKPSKSSGLSPAEQLKQSQVVIPYKEPSWSGMADEQFNFEVLKNGTIIATINLNTKPYYVIGRLPSCDVHLEHPSLSRHHAVVQYSSGKDEEREAGWYLYDLDSTHGTWINKHKVPAKVFHRIRVGYVLKFGGSTRHFILQVSIRRTEILQSTTSFSFYFYNCVKVHLCF